VIRIPRTQGQIYHVPKGTPYHVENSLHGVGLAKAHGYVGIDLDVNGDADDIIWATHWGRPMLRDGFRDPLRRLSRFRQMHQMTSEEVARLRTRDGYQIRRVSQLIKEARRKGLVVEVEAKPSPPLYGKAAWRNLAAELGGDTQEGLLVKVLLDLGPNPQNRLKAAHAAGFRTCAIVHGGHGLRREWAPFVDTYRA
jgi:glycerophosphoryl diester phosphodiesterase